MKSDSKLKSRELDAVKASIRRHYRKENEQKEALKDFQKILNSNYSDYDIVFLCTEINDKLDDVAVTELFMEILAVAYADDDFNKDEKNEINAIRDYLGISTQEHQRIYSLFMNKRRKEYYKTKTKTDSQQKQSYSQSSDRNYNQSHQQKSEEYSDSAKYITIEEQEAYDILGVDCNASDDEIKTLAVKYHPDRVERLGDETIRQATESMKVFLRKPKPAYLH